MKFHWCWRCKTEVPMLEKHEWDLVKKAEPEYCAQIEESRRRRPNFGELKRRYAHKREKVFKDILGDYDTNISSKCSLYNHARPLYGTQCKNCGKLLRGPRSIICFECGWKKKV